jgi:hypothetical protein
MGELANIVRARTVLEDDYRKHAANQSINWYLSDWREARDRLDRQIAEVAA